MGFPASRQWEYTPELASAVGQFILNVAHLEWDLARMVPELLHDSKDSWLTLHRKVTIGQSWDMVHPLLQRAGMPREKLADLNHRIRRLINFRNELVHGTWIASRKRLREIRFDRETEDDPLAEVSLEDLEGKTQEILDVFNELRDAYWSLPEGAHKHHK